MSAKTKLAVVTGASGGLGSELCRIIAARGIRLILIDRNLQKSQAFAAELNKTYAGLVQDTFAVDLASHTDIGRMTRQLLPKYTEIDYLFNNAGVLTENLQFSQHGNELHFEVNTLASLALIDQLRPALANANGASVVSTSAGLSMGVKALPWDDLMKPKEFKKLYGPYVTSKQALNVISAGLAPELAKDHIIVRTADPGPNRTGLTKGSGTPLWMRLFYWALPAPNKGAKKIADAAFATKWGDKSGIFISDDKIQTLPPALGDKEFQRDLLRKCREQAAKS